MGLRPGCELFMKPRRVVSLWEPPPHTPAFPLPGPGLDGALAWRGSGVGGDCAKWVSRVEGLRAVGGTRVQARGCQGTVISSREQSAAPGRGHRCAHGKAQTLLWPAVTVAAVTALTGGRWGRSCWETLPPTAPCILRCLDFTGFPLRC